MKQSASLQPLSNLPVFSLEGVQMKTFHITWFSFFVCFFGWFGLAPLMPTIKEDLQLDKSQIGSLIIASVSGTIIARLLIGKLCDTWGPRKTYTALLLLGAIPVCCVGLAHSYSGFLLFRLAISVIGASFVITQFHTSMMFASSVKGTANAVAGGWGNLGGGVTNMVMPILFAAIIGFGFTKQEAWRYAMIAPAILMVLAAFLYFRYTKDTPAGNYEEIDRGVKVKRKTDYSVLKDWRVWALTLAYSVCFGMEITFDNVAALHFVNEYNLSQGSAGFWAGVFGCMNIFARALGGLFADKVGRTYGIKGKGLLLAAVLFLEGVGIILFAMAGSFVLAIISMLFFAFFLKMANGATYAITPFINTKNMGLVSGVVGAGGNVGGMVFGFLFKSESLTYLQAFQYIGLGAMVIALIVWLTNFSGKEIVEETAKSPIPVPVEVLNR